MTNQEQTNLLQNADLWSRMETEIKKVNELIENNVALTNNDIKQLRAIHKEVESHKKAFSKQLKERVSMWNGLVDQKLEEIGYVRINTILDEIKAQNAQERDKRLEVKLERLKEIIQNNVTNNTNLEWLSVNIDYLSCFLAMFPDLNTGAKNKDKIDWSVVELVVSTMCTNANNKIGEFNKTDIETLSTASDFNQTFVQYFRTGNEELLTSLTELTMNDKEYLMNKKLEAMITSDEIAYEMIVNTINKDLEINKKLQLIRKITEIEY